MGKQFLQFSFVDIRNERTSLRISESFGNGFCRSFFVWKIFWQTEANESGNLNRIGTINTITHQNNTFPPKTLQLLFGRADFLGYQSDIHVFVSITFALNSEIKFSFLNF